MESQLASILADFWMAVDNRMTELRVSHETLARRLGCTRQNLSQRVRSQDMKLSTMIAIASCLQLTFVVIRSDDAPREE